jgi:choline dehydrogenase-like flavoprotein
MIDDARHVPSGSELAAEICIVGAGPAGITLALELARAGRRVLLVESGGRGVVPAAQELNEGRTLGLPALPLTETRYRALGGSTVRWEGRCLTLDPVDFERREEIAESGWPLTWDELVPYFARSSAYCKLPHHPAWSRSRAQSLAVRMGLDRDRVDLRWAQVRRLRWGNTYRRALRRSRDITALLNATVLDLGSADGDGRLGVLRCGTLAGGRFTVRAGTYVLAAGGIENPRLLLTASASRLDGKGLGGELVGHYYADHPHVSTVSIERPGRRLLAAAGYHYSRSGHGVLTFGEATLRREGLLQAGGYIRPFWPYMEDAVYESESIVAARELLHVVRARIPSMPRRLLVARAARGLPALARATLRRSVQRLSPPPTADLRIALELEPRHENRISLAAETDAFGIPRPEVHWTAGERERRSLRRFEELVRGEIERCGEGKTRLIYAEGSDDWIEGMHNGKHPTGATRMHDDPRRGVVDRDSRVHGVANLYVAGSSVFPTYSFANPTLTIVALALRLADHLKR